MKIAVTGHKGQIGSRLIKLGCEPLLCDVTKSEEVEEALRITKPNAIIHLAARTSVEWCEKNYTEAAAINVFGTSVLCQLADEMVGKGRVVLVSSDHVFDGTVGTCAEEEDPNPINEYGLTKFAAEGVANIYGNKIIRTSRAIDGKCEDINAYLAHLKQGNPIQVPNFIFRSYTHLDFLAEAFMEYAKRFDEMPRILHVAGAYTVSFHSLMTILAEEFGYSANLVRERGELPGFSTRPAKGGLDVYKAVQLGLPIYDVMKTADRIKNEPQL